jgi:hypothetical protein
MYGIGKQGKEIDYVTKDPGRHGQLEAKSKNH